MRRVETAAEEADPLAGSRWRNLQPNVGPLHQGRIWPLPRTTYLKVAELLEADGAAGVEFAGGDADFPTKAEFAAVCELGRGVVEEDGAIDFGEEALH